MVNGRWSIVLLRQCFVTLKDHKTNFQNSPSCRLLNPTKTEIGRISKQILEKIVATVRERTKFNQWKNTASVIDWFKNIVNKKRFSFIVFDICDFYPSISEELLNAALDFAKDFIEISDEDRKIIKQENHYSSVRRHNGSRKETQSLMLAKGALMELKSLK